MNPPLASLSEIVLAVHGISGYLLFFSSVLLAVISILSRNEAELLAKAEPLARLIGLLLVLVFLTGAFRVVDQKITFLQGWIVASLLLGVAALGIVHGLWRPRAKKLDQNDDGGDAILISGALGVGVMIFGATYLMESQPG